jgi:hypothetical protein
MHRKLGVVALALALLLALAPAASALEPAAGPPATPDSQAGQALKYIACAGGIVFMVISPISIFYTAILCAEAMLND